MTGIATIATADRAGAAPSGSDRRAPVETSGEAAGIQRLFAFRRARQSPGKVSLQFAGHRWVALLNDALLRGSFRTGSGRIAQLVEQMTLNQRVPGSSPGAPTIAILTGMGHRFGERGWRHRHFEREMDRDDRGRDRGFDRDRYDRDSGPGRGGPERL